MRVIRTRRISNISLVSREQDIVSTAFVLVANFERCANLNNVYRNDVYRNESCTTPDYNTMTPTMITMTTMTTMTTTTLTIDS